MSKVSVIVPMYNAECFIEETLSSILASDYDDIEIVVMDDGSSDHSVETVNTFISQHDNRYCISLHSQANAGVSAARNHAIRLSTGTYILPVDADDKISPNFICEAVKVLEERAEVKAVSTKGEFFGARTGAWKLPQFSLRLLARKNMIPATAMYRRADYDKTMGYNEQFPIREDWDFWLSLFADGGEYVQLPFVGLYYRIGNNSKRTTDRQKKRQLIAWLNLRHKQFFDTYLNGPLHYHRTWSRLLNLFRRDNTVGSMTDLASHFALATNIMYKGRNEIRETDGVVIKSFKVPSFFKGIIYGMLLKSKARRSYEYALRLGNITPQPIAYQEVRYCGILRESYYASAMSECKHTFRDLIGNPDFPHRNDILQAIGRFTASLHEQGIYHKDYSAGNILFEGTTIQIVDLNRLRFLSRPLTQAEGCRNFERLNIDRDALTLMAYAYADARGFNPQQCAEMIINMRWKKHVKQGITNL